MEEWGSSKCASLLVHGLTSMQTDQLPLPPFPLLSPPHPSSQVVASGLQAGKFVGTLAKACGGGGGGRPNFAQAGGRQPEKLPEALAAAKEDLMAKLSQ